MLIFRWCLFIQMCMKCTLQHGLGQQINESKADQDNCETQNS